MIEIKNYQIVEPLVSKCQCNLNFRFSNLNNSKVRIWVDNKENPSCVFLLEDSIMRIIGYPKSQRSLKKIEEFYQNMVYGSITNNLAIFYSEPKWEKLLLSYFKNLRVCINNQSYFQLSLEDNIKTWEANEILVKNIETVLTENYQNLDLVKEEISFINNDLNDYLKNNFGYCVVDDNRIIGYLLSKNHFENILEIQFNFLQEDDAINQTLFSKFIKEAKSRGYQEIRLQCNSMNLSTISIIVKLGFIKNCDSDFIYLDL